MSSRVRWLALAALTLIYAWPGVRLASSPWRGRVGFRHEHERAMSPPAEPAPPGPGEFVSPDLPGISVHAASIAELPDGRLVASWYAGSREGAKDVRILMASRPAGPDSAWGPPREIVSPESASRELGRYVRKLGNAVIFADEKGALWLVYVSVAVGGWSGCSLNVKRSADGGESWSPSQRLSLSPMLNLSELVRARPAQLDGGGIALPIYHENIAKFPELLWLKETASGGLSWRKSRISWGRSFIQPSLAVLGERQAVALLRDCSGRRELAIARTSDAGSSWSPPEPTGLPNPDAAIDALALPGGRVLLAFNDSTKDRSNLKLAASADGGKSWTRLATLEEEGSAEFSYPYMIRSRTGTIHLVYTWHRKRIRHVCFDESWVELRLRELLRGRAR